MSEIKKNLEDEMRPVFDEFYEEKHPSQTLYDYARRLVKIERKYERMGMTLDEIDVIRRMIANEPQTIRSLDLNPNLASSYTKR